MSLISLFTSSAREKAPKVKRSSILAASPSSELPETAKSFGIIGGFPGDDELWKEIAWCQDTFGVKNQVPTTNWVTTASSKKDDPPIASKPGGENFSDKISQDVMARLISIMDRLPYFGRNALTANVLAKSPYCNEILEKLFDYCVFNGRQGSPVLADQNSGNNIEEQAESSVKSNEDDVANDEFILVLTDSTMLIDTSKYHILQAVLVLISFCDPKTGFGC